MTGQVPRGTCPVILRAGLAVRPAGDRACDLLAREVVALASAEDGDPMFEVRPVRSIAHAAFLRLQIPRDVAGEGAAVADEARRRLQELRRLFGSPDAESGGRTLHELGHDTGRAAGGGAFLIVPPRFGR
jgi:hypothetical protein